MGGVGLLCTLVYRQHGHSCETSAEVTDNVNALYEIIWNSDISLYTYMYLCFFHDCEKQLDLYLISLTILKWVV